MPMEVLKAAALGWLIVSLLQTDQLALRVHGVLSCMLFCTVYYRDAYMLTVQGVLIFAHLRYFYKTRVSWGQVKELWYRQVGWLVL